MHKIKCIKCIESNLKWKRKIITTTNHNLKKKDYNEEI